MGSRLWYEEGTYEKKSLSSSSAYLSVYRRVWHVKRDMTPANAEMTWKRVDFISGIVTAYELNVRKGPSTKYQIIGTLKKNQWVNVLAEIDDGT